MKLVTRKNNVCIFTKSPSCDDGVVIFIGEKRFDVTKEQFDKLAEASEKDGTDGFASFCLSLGIKIDKNNLN